MPDGDGNASDLNNNGGGQVTGIRAQFSDPYKNHEAFTSMNKADDLAVAYLDTMAKVKDYEGKITNSIPKPKENATDEEMAAYYKAIGRPDKADEYEIKVPEGLPQGEEMAKWFKEAAHKYGLPKKQAEQLASDYLEKIGVDIKNIDDRITQNREKAESTLKSEWGGDYDKMTDGAKKAARFFFGEDGMKWLEDTKLGNETLIIKALAKVYEKMDESVFVQPSSPPSIGQTTPGGQPMLSFPSMEKK